jgi:hypothetical protein
MDSQHKDDIQQALSEVRHEGTESGQDNEGTADTHHGAVAVALPKTRNPIALLWWGVCNSVSKLWAVIRKHPWWSALALGGSIACAQFACVYFGTMVLGGLMIWSMKKHE